MSEQEASSPSRMLVLHLISTGGFYGAERMLLEHIVGSATQTVHRILFLDAPQSVIEKFRSSHIECSRINGLSHLSQLLAEMVVPAVLNCHGYKALFFGWLASLNNFFPIVATLHGFTPVSRKQKFYGWLNLMLCKLGVVRKVVCVAESIALVARCAGVPHHKIQVIPNGISASGNAVPIMAPTGKPLLGFIGRIRSEKGPDLFIDTFLRVKADFPEAQAILLGDGRDAASLMEFCRKLDCAEDIHFAGYSENVAGWLKALDVLVISSRTEGTPMILLEAMAARTPVASFAVGGIPDVLGEDRFGLVSPPGNVEVLAKQIIRLLRDKVLAEQLTEDASRLIAEQYDARRLAAVWADLYRAAGAR